MRFYWLTLSTLAVWRITHFLQAEDGPWDVGRRLRQRVGTGAAGRLLHCFYCLSFWIAAVVAGFVAGSGREFLLLWPALSGAAILLERVTASGAPQALYFEEEEEEERERKDDELLRRPPEKIAR
jgi:hypothetical protein